MFFQIGEQKNQNTYQRISIEPPVYPRFLQLFYVCFVFGKAIPAKVVLQFKLVLEIDLIP